LCRTASRRYSYHEPHVVAMCNALDHDLTIEMKALTFGLGTATNLLKPSPRSLAPRVPLLRLNRAHPLHRIRIATNVMRMVHVSARFFVSFRFSFFTHRASSTQHFFPPDSLSLSVFLCLSLSVPTYRLVPKVNMVATVLTPAT